MGAVSSASKRLDSKPTLDGQLVLINEKERESQPRKPVCFDNLTGLIGGTRSSGIICDVKSDDKLGKHMVTWLVVESDR